MFQSETLQHDSTIVKIYSNGIQSGSLVTPHKQTALSKSVFIYFTSK